MYRRLLGLFPSGFRETAGEELCAVFHDEYAEVRQAGRRAGVAVFWTRVLIDLVWSVVREWWAVVWKRTESSDRLTVKRRTDGFASVIRDLRFAGRSLRKRPTFAAIAVATLALGTGGATAMFSVVDGVLLRDLPYDDPETLVSVWLAWPDWRGDEYLDEVWDRIQFTWDDYVSVRRNAKSLSQVAAHGQSDVIMTGTAAAERLSVGEVSGDLYGLLGVRPILGRTFLSHEVPPDGVGAHVAVLSHELWRRRFGGREDVIGRTLSLDDDSFEIIGVLPRGFSLPSEIIANNSQEIDHGMRDVWVPFGPIVRPRDHNYEVVARLAPGYTVAQVEVEVTGLLPEGRREQHARVIARKDVVTEGFRTPLILLLSAAGVLLLIACTNVMGLLVGRATERHREIAVRAALGASRGRIVRHLLTESALLGLLGAAAGIGLAWVGTGALLTFAPPLPRLAEIGLNHRIFGFAAAIGVGTGMLFGVVPALVLSRRSTGATLRTRSRVRGMSTLQMAVVATQLGLTVVLLVVGGLFGRSLARVMSVDPGFVPENLSTITVHVPLEREESPELQTQFFDEVLRVAQSVPGVMSVGATTDLPFPAVCCSNSVSIRQRGRDVERTHFVRRVSAAYAETIGIPLLQGRTLSPADGPTRPVPVLVSRSLADLDWPGESAIGQRISWDGEGDLVVVGVVGDIRQRALREEVAPTIYLPFSYQPKAQMEIVARVAGHPRGPLPALRRAIQAIDPNIPIGDARSVASLMRASEAESRFRTVLMWTFAGLATILAAVGIFGVTAQTVAVRSRELGIRMALGAKHRQLIRLVLQDGFRSLAAGVALGLLGAAAAVRTIGPMLYEVGVGDPATYVGVVLLAGTVSLVAAYVPARRVLAIPPMIVMADE